MATPNVQVSSQAMAQAEQRFVATYDHNKRIQTRILDELAILQSSWTGETATRFQQVMLEWNEQFEVVQRSLDTMIQTLGANRTQYERAEDDGATTQVGGLSSILAS